MWTRFHFQCFRRILPPLIVIVVPCRVQINGSLALVFGGWACLLAGGLEFEDSLRVAGREGPHEAGRARQQHQVHLVKTPLGSPGHARDNSTRFSGDPPGVFRRPFICGNRLG